MDLDQFEKQYWYVLHTKSKFEKVVTDSLLKKDIHAFLPTIMKLSKRKDRKKILEVPMFPGYLFVKSNILPKNHVNILKTTGAVRLLGSNKGPMPVNEASVESLRLFSKSKETISTGKGFKKGEEVVITDGPLAGAKGIYEKKAGKNRVIVQIDILGQYAFTEVEKDNIEFLSHYLFSA